MRAPGYDTASIAYLPSYTAIAYYYKKGKHTGTMAEAVEQAREFARGPYAEALRRETNCPPRRFDAVAAKVADFTGLSVQYLKETKLRISPSRFRKELLRDDDRTFGRYDARFEGWDVDSAGETPGYDPSNTGPEGAFVGAFHDYLQNELKYTSTDPYYSPRPGVTQAWDYQAPPQRRRPAEQQQCPTPPSISPTPCARTPSCKSSPPTATSTWPRRSSPPSTTSAT